MKIYKILFSVLIIALLSGCTDSSRLEEALEFAGENRVELEKVLEHYKGDKLKYKAAYFLIENMPYHYGMYHEKLDSLKIDLYNFAVDSGYNCKQALEALERKHGRLEKYRLKKLYDSDIITADYLIKHIDFAFGVWEMQGWHEQVSFDDFCELILPYRVGTEPLEEWQELFHNRFQPLLDSLLVNKKDPVEAMAIVYDSIVNTNWVFYQEIPFHSMGTVNFIDHKIGSCYHRAEFATLVMRSLGIAGGMDYLFQYPTRAGGAHTWNFVKDSLGQVVEFTLYDQRPGETFDFVLRKGRVFRKFFNRQHNYLLNYMDEVPPGSPVLGNFLYRDVSNEYFLPYQLTIDVSGQKQGNGIVFLCIFDCQDWTPVAWTKVKNKKAVFEYVEGGVTYLPVYYEDGVRIPASLPVRLEDDGSYRFIEANYEEPVTMELTRKYPVQYWWDYFLNRPVGGKFQASNDPGFTNPVTWHTITQQLDMKWNMISINDENRYRYVRYLSAENAHCNMAELEFIGEDEEELKGKIIGTNSSIGNNPTYNRFSVFDKDPLTFYDAAEPSDGWVGLDLGSPKRITQLNYLFRNDDNHIRVGDEYELVYWGNGEWVSLGKRIADDYKLIYENCPSRAVYVLHNHTRGHEERIFVYEDGEIKWW